MACSYPRSRIAVEVFVEQNQIPPVRIGLEFLKTSEHRPAALFIAQKDVGHAARQFSRYIPQGQHGSRSRWKFDLEVVAEIVVKFLQRLHQQVIRWKPDGAAPVRIAAE